MSTNPVESGMKLKYLFPAVQSTVAIFLLHQYQLWMVLTRHADMPGPGPAAILLSIINLPAAAIRGIWFRSFDVFWPDWIFVVALALFWYWAGREIALRIEQRTRDTIKLRLARIAIDVLLTAQSVWFILESNTDFRWFPRLYCCSAAIYFQSLECSGGSAK